MSTALTNATESIFNGTESTSRYINNRPIKFRERGIALYVFTNGEFDFNTHAYPYGNRRRGVNTTFGTNNNGHIYYGSTNNNFGPRGVRVEYDYYGRVRRVGNVFINYDTYGRIKRIGRVYIVYRHRRVARVGDKRLIYNRRGRLVRTIGRVKSNGAGFGNSRPFSGDQDRPVDPWDNDDGWDWNDQDGDWDDNLDWDDPNGDVLYLRGQEGKDKKPVK